MQNPLIQMMMNQLQARSNGGNPMELFKKVTNGYSSEQMNNLFTKAKQFGVPEDVIEQLQNNGIDTK